MLVDNSHLNLTDDISSECIEALEHIPQSYQENPFSPQSEALNNLFAQFAILESKKALFHPKKNKCHTMFYQSKSESSINLPNPVLEPVRTGYLRVRIHTSENDSQLAKPKPVAKKETQHVPSRKQKNIWQYLSDDEDPTPNVSILTSFEPHHVTLPKWKDHRVYQDPETSTINDYNITATHKLLEVAEGRIQLGLEKSFKHPIEAYKIVKLNALGTITGPELQRFNNYDQYTYQQKVPSFWPKRDYDHECLERTRELEMMKEISKVKAQMTLSEYKSLKASKPKKLRSQSQTERSAKKDKGTRANSFVSLKFDIFSTDDELANITDVEDF